MKVIIAGSRDFNDYTLLCKVCDHMLQKQELSTIEIVSGTARGADKLGEKYAEERGYKVKLFPADWDKYSNKAGFLRNQEMSEYADALIAFWSNNSKGTEHMIKLAKDKGLKVKVVEF